MTQPSLTTTFDTSLIDLSPAAQFGGSFSTTDTDPSDFGAPSTVEAPPPDPSSDHHHHHHHNDKNTPAAKTATLPSSSAISSPPKNQSIKPLLKPSHSPHASSPFPPSPRPAKRAEMEHYPSSSTSSSAASAAAATTASSAAAAAATAPQPRKPSTPVRHMDTTSAYDAWAAVYDSDGNILQAVDDLELEALLPAFLERVEREFDDNAAAATTASFADGGDGVLRVVDLGCGTGRNTEKLLRHAWGEGAVGTAGSSSSKEKRGRRRRRVEVTGVDASAGMLGRAREKLGPLTSGPADKEPTPTLQLLHHDVLHPSDPASSPDALPTARYHAAISTLVLEHLPLDLFFRTLAALLVPPTGASDDDDADGGGLVLVTNMHSDMGARSQAGFVVTDERGEKVKVRGKSWAYGIAETVGAARAAGFEVVGELVGDGGEGKGEGENEQRVLRVKERAVDEELIREGRVGERGWKWVGVKVWFGLVLRRVR